MGNWPTPDVSPLPALVGSYEELELGGNLIPVRGPTEGMFLAQLWDLMLCMAVPARVKRRRGENVEAMTRGLYNNRVSYSHLPDEVIHELFHIMQVELSPAVFFRLWAPLADPSTGQLVSDLATALRKLLDIHRIPPSEAERRMGSAIKRFPIRDGKKLGARLPGLAIIHRPSDLVKILDPQGRIHCPHGPAIVAGDGTPIFFWRGVQVPSYFIPITDEWRRAYPDVKIHPLTRPHRVISAEHALSIINVEVRRAACEIVGWHNILEQLDFTIVDTDPDPTIGELLRVQIPTGRGFANRGLIQSFLRVRCGTGRTFALVVPNECETALEANAWTYGLSPEEYRPEVRT